jgi:hypothetical protein
MVSEMITSDCFYRAAIVIPAGNVQASAIPPTCEKKTHLFQNDDGQIRRVCVRHAWVANEAGFGKMKPEDASIAEVQET